MAEGNTLVLPIEKTLLIMSLWQSLLYNNCLLYCVEIKSWQGLHSINLSWEMWQFGAKLQFLQWKWFARTLPLQQIEGVQTTTNLVCNCRCQTCWSITFSVTNFSDADAWWSMPMQRPWAISRIENKVKLSSASSNAFERSSRSDNKRETRVEQNLIWKHRSEPGFALNKFPEMCFLEM